MTLTIANQIEKLDSGHLKESQLKEHIWPLFARVIEGCRKRGEIYLANHSLGRPLDQVATDVDEGLRLWYEKLDDAWDCDGWPEAMEQFRARLSRLLGLSDSKAVAPKASAGSGLRAVLNALPVDGSQRPIKVVATRGEFDSIEFILKVYREKGRAKVNWIEPCLAEAIPMYRNEDILAAITSDVDLVVLSHVGFSTGQVMPNLADTIDHAHRLGALVLVDGYHSVGVMPVDMMELGADFMIGGSYKYLRGGPGACWLAIHPKHLDGGLRTLDTGWFAKREPFSYDRPEKPEWADSGDGWLESTPACFSFYQTLAGLEFLELIGVERIRSYNLTQQQVLRKAFVENGVACFEPQNPLEFGAFTLVPHNDSDGFVRKLKVAGVNADSRIGFVRFGPDLLNSASELDQTAAIVGQVSRSY